MMSERGIAGFYNPEITRAARSFSDRGEAAQKLIAMHKRHAATVFSVVNAQVKLHSEALVDGTLDKTSLLGMIGRGEHLGRESDPSLEAGCLNDELDSREGDDGFRFWDGYRQVELHKERFTLSPAQAAAVRVLHTSFLKGQPTISSRALLFAMGDLAPSRLSAIFRSDDPRKALIQRVGKDSYRLNV